VQDALTKLGLTLQVVELFNSTRSAVEAIAAIVCKIRQIAKSLIFKTQINHRPILVIASDPNSIDEQKITALVSEKVTKADANFVRKHTGFINGSVPPVGHLQPIKTFVDQELLIYEEIWAAAGTSNAVFHLSGDDLVQGINGQLIAVN
jgi:prolyl-tRNA editing enzyme YbaK/EbsC (Cys-tRNA(Pro) deacylase)